MTPSRIPFTTLVTQLTDVDRDVRRQAIASIMRRSEREKALSVLVGLSTDPDDQVFKAAIRAIVAISPSHSFSLLEPLLIAPGPCPSIHRQVFILKALTKADYARTVRYWLSALLTDQSRLMGKAAVTTLNDARAFDSLVSALSDPDKRVRLHAVSLLKILGDARALDPLIAALSDHDALVRQSAAEALGKLGDARALDPLVAALNDPYTVVRWSAAEALGKLGDARALDPLINALNDSDQFVRLNTVWALGSLGDARALVPLHPLLTDPVKRVAQAARDARALLNASV